MCDNVKEKNSKKAFTLIARDFFYVRKMQKIAKNNRNIASNKSLNHNHNHNIQGSFSQLFSVATLAIIHKRRNLPNLATSQRGMSNF
jgi:hypothetical protein